MCPMKIDMALNKETKPNQLVSGGHDGGICLLIKGKSSFELLVELHVF